MATLTITVAGGAYPGEVLRKLAEQIEACASGIPDTTSTGASTVLTIDNLPAAGNASVQVTAGPYQSSKFYV